MDDKFGLRVEDEMVVGESYVVNQMVSDSPCCSEMLLSFSTLVQMFAIPFTESKATHTVPWSQDNLFLSLIQISPLCLDLVLGAGLSQTCESLEDLSLTVLCDNCSDLASTCRN